jgi:mRNA interferase MazF
MKKGDIVLVPFPFTDLSGNKNRPAIVLIETSKDVTLSFITTQLKWQSKFDLLLKPTPINGLKKDSLIKLSKIITLDKDLIIGLMRYLDKEYYQDLNENLINIFKLNTQQ